MWGWWTENKLNNSFRIVEDKVEECFPTSYPWSLVFENSAQRPFSLTEMLSWFSLVISGILGSAIIITKQFESISIMSQAPNMYLSSLGTGLYSVIQITDLLSVLKWLIVIALSVYDKNCVFVQKDRNWTLRDTSLSNNFTSGTAVDFLKAVLYPEHFLLHISDV